MTGHHCHFHLPIFSFLLLRSLQGCHYNPFILNHLAPCLHAFFVWTLLVIDVCAVDVVCLSIKSPMLLWLVHLSGAVSGHKQHYVWFTFLWLEESTALLLIEVDLPQELDARSWAMSLTVTIFVLPGWATPETMRLCLEALSVGQPW